jgi:hypothetical protein
MANANANANANATGNLFYNGTYTITNGAGEHRTFRIRFRPKFAGGSFVVGLLTGSDNDRDYDDFAFVKADSGKVCVWTKKRSKLTNYYAVLLQKAFFAIAKTEEECVETEFSCAERPYSVLLSKRCLRCNRKLTNPESIRRGIGPECANK